jgi:hypothetical protein
MGIQISRAKRMLKMLDALLLYDHLYSDEKLKDMKAQRKVLKEEIAEMKARRSKGFGK